MLKLSLKLNNNNTNSEPKEVPRLTIAVPTKVLLSSKQEPFPASWEDHLLLRLPLSLATRLRRDLRDEQSAPSSERHPLFQAASTPPDDLAIQWLAAGDAGDWYPGGGGSQRRLRLQLEGKWWPALLLDRPTITETLRASHDRALYYKTGDLGQLVMVYETEREAREAHQAFSALGWQWPHGLTAPLQNAPRPQMQLMRRVEELEERVASLIAKDEQATRSEYTLYDAQGNEVGAKDDAQRMVDNLLGQLGDNDDHDENGDDHDGEDEDREADGLEAQEGEQEEAEEEEELLDLAAEINLNLTQEAEQEEEEEVVLEQVPAKQQAEGAAKLAATLAEKREQLARITNPAIRARLEEVIRQLEAELQQQQQRL